MAEAIAEAEKAFAEDEVPVGAIIVHEAKIIARAHNTRQNEKNALGHAELLAIQQACQVIGDWRLENCELFVTLEPCPMCAGAILNSRIPKVYYGTRDPKAGAVSSLFQLLSDKRLNHQAEIHEGLMKDTCSLLLKNFFQQKRKR